MKLKIGDALLYWLISKLISMEREEIQFVQARYHQLNLTVEQAEKVLRYENMKESYSRTDMFSAWEEWDFEYSVFQELLNEHQMVQYQQRIGEMKEMHIVSLIEQDNSHKIWLEQTREKIDYLKMTLVPSIVFDQSHMVLSLIVDRSKIDYLRANYRTFLHEQRKKILVDHFRFNKTYAPIQLKSRLLGHYASCLIPDYLAFENWMDEPTRAVAAFAKAKLPRRSSEVCEFYQERLRELKLFSDQIFKKYYRHIEGWSVWVADPLPEEEESTNWLMSMLLLDVNAYGFDPID
ncbi:hypothetical protein J2Y45_003854 [Dyadobacter sp. BE34]|uniref:Uncharacterized protein n=1 Tax=Dyadobacter fermentans TaxID=94254 RepID=A0ABU1QZS5_9BACT|nr:MULTISPECIES: hypothetical protein [Dyadobacter]MDR6806662.1 hypothetical protein [Dyadobacter fermentans]MDR7044404.1 hypothetical protein [Dyadobacter sp. BE242]MDR7198714.1 hypothetical protein [Dyadobacter sp. BE34]MDR7216676.1 hypothetical protein [Dyadobacter sp. BE31]MDR7263798.1 hypothetical protein [Dyadobacter sp. BE32]